MRPFGWPSKRFAWLTVQWPRRRHPMKTMAPMPPTEAAQSDSLSPESSGVAGGVADVSRAVPDLGGARSCVVGRVASSLVPAWLASARVRPLAMPVMLASPRPQPFPRRSLLGVFLISGRSYGTEPLFRGGVHVCCCRMWKIQHAADQPGTDVVARLPSPLVHGGFQPWRAALAWPMRRCSSSAAARSRKTLLVCR